MLAKFKGTFSLNGTSVTNHCILKFVSSRTIKCYKASKKGGNSNQMYRFRILKEKPSDKRTLKYLLEAIRLYCSICLHTLSCQTSGLESAGGLLTVNTGVDWLVNSEHWGHRGDLISSSRHRGINFSFLHRYHTNCLRIVLHFIYLPCCFQHC